MNVFKTAALLTATLSAALAVPNAAFAAGSDSTASFRITAVVQPFCRVHAQAADVPLQIVDGAVELGFVREICNTPGGYRTDVQMINVTSGRLMHSAGFSTLNNSGAAQLISSRPQSVTAPWRLVDATLGDSGAPVYLRVSISPL